MEKRISVFKTKALHIQGIFLVVILVNLWMVNIDPRLCMIAYVIAIAAIYKILSNYLNNFNDNMKINSRWIIDNNYAFKLSQFFIKLSIIMSCTNCSCCISLVEAKPIVKFLLYIILTTSEMLVYIKHGIVLKSIEKGEYKK